MPVQTLPVGRLVYGHPSKLIQKTDTKRQPVMKDGQPVMVHQFGVAYPKDVFNAQIWPIMYHAAKAVFQGYEPPLPPTTLFSYKFKDGDGVDKQMRPYSAREGYAGHCVVHFETQFDLLAYRQNTQTGGWDQITENDYKTGDYIAVNCSIEGNKPDNAAHTPGLFINPQGVLLMGHGPAIINAPSADQMFGGVNVGTLPPGALPPGSMPAVPAGAPNPPGFGGSVAAPPVYAQPPQAAPVAPPQYQPQPAPVVAPPVYQQQPAAPVYAQPPQAAPAVPGAPVYPPAYDVVQNATGQPIPGAPAYAPPPGQPQAPQYQPQPAPGGVPLSPGAQPPR